MFFSYNVQVASEKTANLTTSYKHSISVGIVTILLIQVGMVICAIYRSYLSCKAKCQGIEVDKDGFPVVEDCQLCRKEVIKAKFDQHRLVCPGRNNYGDLTAIRSKCGKCERNLRLIPKENGGKFICDMEDCGTYGSKLNNEGDNRYNCFVCNFDKCKKCLEDEGPESMEPVDDAEGIPAIDPELELNCYLCERKVKYGGWGAHRKKCPLRTNLFNYRQVDANCEGCGTALRILPKTKGEGAKNFGCNYKDHLVKNNGQNRYNCFDCDYDICPKCVKKKKSDPAAV